MRREIEFRAWDGVKMIHNVNPFRWDFVISNSWHKCEKSTGSGLFGSGGDTAEMLVPAVRYKELMQYTGLKDKNGTPIYEGDIVKWGYGIPSVVEFANGCFMWDGSPLAYEIENNFELTQTEDWAEVIGNIYQNPELITNR